jgi:hypothetical protein
MPASWRTRFLARFSYSETRVTRDTLVRPTRKPTLVAALLHKPAADARDEPRPDSPLVSDWADILNE